MRRSDSAAAAIVSDAAMAVPFPSKRVASVVCAPLLALLVSACGASVSTGNFKGEEHEVAQAIANLQSDATAAEPAKICQNDLAASVVSRLGGRSACEKAIKNQLTEIDSLEASVQSIKIDHATNTATATVKSTYGGKNKLAPLLLVKEGGKWKVSSLG
jgi:copper chaperone CopZ